MMLDIIVLLAIAFAVIKGIRNGLIIAVFSMLGFVIGLAAALKLSTIVAAWLSESTNINVQWLPFIAFALVFFITVFAIRFAATLIEKAVDMAWMGWVNKLAGVLVYGLLYILILSVLFFYASQMKLVTDESIAASRTYPYIEPLGPKVIELIAIVIPVFSNMFGELQAFFEKLGGRLQS